MIKTEYVIEHLSITSVTIKMQRYYDGIALGEQHGRGYVNSVDGRNDLQNDVPEAQVNAVFAVWGDEPTVDDTVNE